MALRQQAGDDKKKVKIGIAVVLLAIAGAVAAWQVMRSGGSNEVDDEIARKAKEAQEALKSASTNPPVPDTAPKPAGRPTKSDVGRGPASVPK